MSNKRDKRRKRGEHPLDEDRLIMDAIYNSRSYAVQSYYRQVIAEEDQALASALERGEGWSVAAYLDRVHRRMGQRFFHLLPPRMRARFLREYPQATVGVPAPSALPMSAPAA